MTRGSSLRTRFLIVVLACAVLPLGVAGWWLSLGTVRSAEAILKMQLDTSLVTLTTDMERRWSYRRGDLLMIAGNEVTARTTAMRNSVTALDSAFMHRTFADLGRVIPVVVVRTSTGDPVWVFGEADGEVLRAEPARPATHDARIVVRIPVGAGEKVVGELDAEVRLSSVLPLDSMPILVPGARLSVSDAHGKAFVYPGLHDVLPDGDRHVLDGETWLVSRKRLAGSPVVVAVAAPTRSYVAPFKRTAWLGLLVLLLVAALSLGFTLFLTLRITHPLENLAVAADIVASGNLDVRVEPRGDGEVARLSRSFAGMIASLQGTLRELTQQRALAATGEFAASMAHEIRNALSAVRIDLQRIEESSSGDPEARELISRSLRNVERLNATVSSALAVARNGMVARETVDLYAVLRTAVEAAEHAFMASGSTITLATGDSMRMPGDSSALEHMFVNVLLNAAQAMEAPGVATVSTSRTGADVIVSISDTGRGMSAAELESLRVPYWSSKRGGTGLGVAIARRIAEAHGGSMTFESSPGAGTVVRVMLPAAREGN